MATQRVVKKAAPYLAPADLLKLLHDRFDFGPALNAKIKAAMVKQPETDPLVDWPKDLLRYPPVLRPRNFDGLTTINLGDIWDFQAFVFHWDNGVTELRVGCRRFRRASDAREHWVRDRNRGLEPRPGAGKLIDYVERICRHKGWKW